MRRARPFQTKEDREAGWDNAFGTDDAATKAKTRPDLDPELLALQASWCSQAKPRRASRVSAMTFEEEHDDSPPPPQPTRVKGGSVNYDAPLFLQALEKFGDRSKTPPGRRSKTKTPLLLLKGSGGGGGGGRARIALESARAADSALNGRPAPTDPEEGAFMRDWASKWDFVYDFVDAEKAKREAEAKAKRLGQQLILHAAHLAAASGGGVGYGSFGRRPYYSAPHPGYSTSSSSSASASSSGSSTPARHRGGSSSSERNDVEDLPNYPKNPRASTGSGTGGGGAGGGARPSGTGSNSSSSSSSSSSGGDSGGGSSGGGAARALAAAPFPPAASWEDFEAKLAAAIAAGGGGPPLKLADVPWPRGAVIAGLQDAPRGSAPAKKLVRACLLRWHPDKFAKVLRVMEPADRAAAAAQAQDVARRILAEKEAAGF